MGKAIVYCGDCGKSLSEEDFAKGRAQTLEDGPYCAGCRPLPAAPAAAVPVPKKISTTRIPLPPPSTRRAEIPAPTTGSKKGILIGGAAAGAAVVALLAVLLSGGRKESPPPPPESPPARPAPKSAETSNLERARRGEREREEAARLDRFLDQIRGMLKDTSQLPERRAEIEGMLAAAEKEAGPRKTDVRALRDEYARALEEARRERERTARLDEILPRIREAIQDLRTLKQRRADVENLLDEADKLAGPRRDEVDALRAECIRAFERAERRREIVGHWRLDGNAQDSSGLSLNGNIRGSPKFASGQVGQALQFNGSDQSVDLPGKPELDRVQEDSYTLCAWLRPDEVPPSPEQDEKRKRFAILTKRGWHLGLTYDHQQHFAMDHWLAKDQNVGVVGDSKACPPGQWHHAAGVVDRDAGTTQIYVNGKLAKKRSWTKDKPSRNYGSEPWRIGCASPGADRFAWPAKGAIDDVRIYGRALSPEEVRAVYEAGLAGRDR